MLLHVFATKVLTHFFDNDMELNYQKFKLVNFADDKTIFSGDINSFASLKPILKLYEGASSWYIEFWKSPTLWTGTYENRTMKDDMVPIFQ